MTLPESVSIISGSLAAAGLFLNWWQLRKNGLQRRGEYISGLFGEYLKDPGLVEIFCSLTEKRLAPSKRNLKVTPLLVLDRKPTSSIRAPPV